MRLGSIILLCLGIFCFSKAQAQKPTLEAFIRKYAAAYYSKDLPLLRKLTTDRFFENYKNEGLSWPKQNIRIQEVKILKTIESKDMVQVQVFLRTAVQNESSSQVIWLRLESSSELYKVDEVLGHTAD